jgi:hypothetical protein
MNIVATSGRQPSATCKKKVLKFQRKKTKKTTKKQHKKIEKDAGQADSWTLAGRPCSTHDSKISHLANISESG